MNSTKFLPQNRQSRSMTSSFFIRKVNQNKYDKDQGLKVKISIEPSKVEFRDYADLIFRLFLKNQTDDNLQFKIMQPKKSCFRVKVRKNSLLPQETIEVYVMFAITINQESNKLTDTFSIHLSQNNSVIIPITNNFQQPFNKQTASSKNLKLEQQKSGKYRIKKRPRDSKGNFGRFLKQKDNKSQIQNLIRDFVTRFEKIQSSIRDKSITNQTFIGQKPLGEDSVIEFSGYNLKMITLYDKQMREGILNRFDVEFGDDGPVICQLNGTYPKYPRWDFTRNISRITYEKGMRKMKEEVRKIIIQNRFDKITKIMQIYRNFQVKDKEERGSDQSKMVKKRNSLDLTGSKAFLTKEKIKKIVQIQECQSQTEQNEFQHARKHNYFCKKIKNIMDKKNQSRFGYEFNKFTLSPKTLEMDYETKQMVKTHHFEIQQRIGFDNWVILEEVAMYSHEIMKYIKMDSTFFINCNALDSCQKNREGCELQYRKNCSESQITQKISMAQLKLKSYIFDSIHENQPPTKEWASLKNLSEQFIKLPEELNQKNLQNQYSSIMNNLLYFKQEFFPFCNANTPENFKKFLNQDEKKIIFKIDYEDRLTLEAFLQKKHHSRFQSLHEKIRRTESQRVRIRKILETEDQLHRKIIQNLEKVGLKQKDRNEAILNSYNKFIKSKNYLILF